MKLALFTLILCFNSMAALKFPSDRLKVMDTETLQRMVNKNLTIAQQALSQSYSPEGEDIDHSQTYSQDDGAKLIRESIELVFAIPEQNKATSNIYSQIESLAAEYEGIFPYLEEITVTALNTLEERGKETSLLRDQNTYLYILNNMMAELKPLVAAPEGARYRKLIEKIRDKRIRLNDSLRSYGLLNSMAEVANPSDIAEQIVGKVKCSWWEFLWC